jgi:hypothetical protein
MAPPVVYPVSPLAANDQVYDFLSSGLFRRKGELARTLRAPR